MSVFSKLNIFDDIGGFIDRKSSEILAAKTKVVVRAALVELDKHAPVLTDILAGRSIKLRLPAGIEIVVEENPKDTQ